MFFPQPVKSEADFADTTDMNMTGIALAGLDRAQVQLDKAATTVANAASPPSSSSSDSVDLSAGIVALMSAKNYFAANISVLKTADQIQKYVIDMMA